MEKNNKKVLIIVAHPDDAEISMGMRIYDYVQYGCEVFIPERDFRHRWKNGKRDWSGCRW